MKSHLLTAVLSAVTAFGVTRTTPHRIEELEVDRLLVRKEFIVSDTGETWETGFEEQMIPRGIYARGGEHGQSGLWVRGRLIQCEVDDPFDTRFHSAYRNGEIHRAPGHISWNCWLDGAWRQMAIIQGEGLEFSEVPEEAWSGANHPGRLRFQTFRPDHPEPLTDATIGQGRMSLGGGGFGGGGLPYASQVLDVWGGSMREHALTTPEVPEVERHDGSGHHTYALVAVSAAGDQSPPSPVVETGGRATLTWDSVPGADAYLILRDGQIVAGPLRREGSQKHWTDSPVDADSP